jgi:hypothetical protein
MINNEEKFMFIHPPKCGGTSIRLVLRKVYNSYHKNRLLEPFSMDLSEEGIDYKTSVHSPLSKFIRLNDDRYGVEGRFNKHEWFVFAVVRNPFDRLVSYYHHIQVNWNERKKDSFLFTFNDWICDESFKDYVKQLITFKEMFHHDGELGINNYIRLENIESDAKIVFDKLGITEYNLPCHKHNTNRTEYDYTKYYNEETRDKVAELFEWDIEYFGYKFGE